MKQVVVFCENMEYNERKCEFALLCFIFHRLSIISQLEVIYLNYHSPAGVGKEVINSINL